MPVKKRRWALVAMGAWLMGMVIVSVVAAENFYTIDRLLAERSNAAFGALVDRIGPNQARDLLRYLSSELNRFYFQVWNVTQLALGGLSWWLLGRDRSTAKARWGVVAMLGVVALMLVWLTPAIVSLGRSVDFVPRDPAPPGIQRFWILHASYTTLEAVKLIVGIVVTRWIARAGADLGATAPY